jgi:ABC-type protease/lipase transport system fused ATPase/permease subunit
VAVLGPVGSGKSTLMRLLAGMVQPSQGHVLIDGLASDQIDRDALRRAMAYMPQDTRLLSGTLRTHLLAGLEPAPDEQRLIDTLRLTGLDQVVAGHPLGLERPLGEGGRGLSAGQRQIAALTRLLLLQQQPTAWLLDEPSASMDDAAEARAVAALRARLGADHTLVVATHRPAWLALVSRVIVITSDGRFVVGPRDEVLRPPARGASSVRTVVAAPAATTANASGCVPGAAAAASAPAASTATHLTRAHRARRPPCRLTPPRAPSPPAPRPARAAWRGCWWPASCCLPGWWPGRRKPRWSRWPARAVR